ncbi:hypothetical protein [Ilumatobacter sp.]|uniref:hypothetical protein n=1 Tax=Ilumatobacter sp. TaxID=1967498 RepID=UPI003B51680D
MRVLIVDDSRTTRTILRRTIVGLGHADVDEEGHGREALERTREHVPGLVLVDTSGSSPRVVYEALEAGADEFAMKPMTPDVIGSELEMMGLSA